MKRQMVVGLQPLTYARLLAEHEQTGESVSLFARKAIEAAYPLGAPPPTQAIGIPGGRPPEAFQTPILVDPRTREVLNVVLALENASAQRQGEKPVTLAAVVREAVERVYPNRPMTGDAPPADPVNGRTERLLRRVATIRGQG